VAHAADSTATISRVRNKYLTDPLLTEALVARLQGLQRLARSRRGLWDTGDAQGQTSGPGRDFLEHKRYAPGDDTRRLDWFASARIGVPLIRVCQREEDSAVRVLLDTSASMACGTPSKLYAAQRFIAAFGYLALHMGHRVQFAAPRVQDPASLHFASELRTSRAAPQLVQALNEVHASGDTHWGAWLTALHEYPRTRTRCVVVSDFLAPELGLTELSRLAARGHEVLLVHLYSRHEYQVLTDNSVPIRGSVTFVDSETSEHLHLDLDATTIAAYQTAVRGRVATLAAWCRAAGARLALVGSHELAFDTVYRLLLPDTGHTFPETSHG
jgi:uncharacterized protein (DUF58 family)